MSCTWEMNGGDLGMSFRAAAQRNGRRFIRGMQLEWWEGKFSGPRSLLEHIPAGRTWQEYGDLGEGMASCFLV